MLTFKIVRKIGKILRGGAGKKEIFLGTLCGVLIGFNPSVSLTLVLILLVTLLLNANMAFTLLGAALGKILCLALAPITFHTGYFIIHNAGLEEFFTARVNAPVTALMDLDVYAMVGSLPYALVIGIASGVALAVAVVRIRKKMLELDRHVIIGKTFGNKVSRFLLWLAFGKSKLSFDDEIQKQTPLLRKSGIIIVASMVLIGLLLEFLLLDMAIKSGLQSAIGAKTGAEVNIGKAHLSIAGGKLEIKNLQITDPEKLTHNLVQIDTLVADVSISDLLRRIYAIDLLAGSTLKRDVLRDKPGKLLAKADPKKDKDEAKEDKPGKSLDDYFAKAKDWGKYGAKANEYLKKCKANAETIAEGETPRPTREAAVADAKKTGYLKASADLVGDWPDWTIRWVKIDDVQLGGDLPAQVFQGLHLSSHPELYGMPTILTLTPADGTDPTAKLVLHLEDPAAMHELTVNLNSLAIGGAVETSDSFPLNIHDGKADIHASGTFSADQLDLPFTIVVHDLKADVEEGQTVMGMDSETATEVFSSIEQLEVEGALGGSLTSPRIDIDYDKLTANMKEALVDAGKKALSKRADKEMDKAKDELMKQGGKELDKLLGGEEGDSTEEKAKGLLKKLF